jgi:putative Mg2+ transporter-C (MgtC) family protein
MKLLALSFIPQLLADLLSRTVARLTLAAFLGGLIGLERELKHRPAGLRTNMFICFGAAMFTVISLELGGANDATRIASQIIPGIGFIGAGSILRDKGGVTGLTTAATVFVVASIGMAVGGGLYLPAVFATVLILLALLILGGIERKFSLKPVMMDYIVVTHKAADVAVSEINKVLEDQNKQLSGMRIARLGERERITFSVAATRNEHRELMECLRQSEDLQSFKTEPGIEIE